METASLDPVIEQTSHEEAAKLLASNAPAAPGTTTADAPAEPLKKKGGFPKGAKRGPGGKKITDAGGVVSPTSTAKPKQVYTVDPAASAPLTGEVRTGAPRMAGVPGAPDPAIVAYLVPKLDMVLKGVTLLLARFTGKPDAVAHDDERALMADAFSQELAARVPELAAQAGPVAMGAASLPYLTRLLELYMPGGPQPSPVPQSPMTPPQPAVEPAQVAAPAPAPIPAEGDNGPDQYGGIPT